MITRFIQKSSVALAFFILVFGVSFFPSNIAQAVYPASCCTITQGGFSPEPTVTNYEWSCTGGACDSGGGGGGGSSIVYPTASLSANPTSITRGQSSTLTWSSTNATSCAGTNFNTGNATSGSVSVSPTDTTVYSVSCVNSEASATAGSTVTVTNGAAGVNVRYAVDWDMNGTVDEIVPASGYVNLGTLQTTNHSWSTTGLKTFQARTQDDNGNVSSWAQYSITISTPQCSDGIDNDGNGVVDLADTGCSGSTDDTESGGTFQCSDGIDNDGNGFTDYPSDTGCSAANDNTELGMAACSTNKTGDINATPSRVNQGSSATLSWNAQNITTSCVISGPGVSQTIPAAACAVPSTASFATPAITTQSVYTLTCDGTFLDSAIVNVIPKIEEF